MMTEMDLAHWFEDVITDSTKFLGAEVKNQVHVGHVLYLSQYCLWRDI